MSSSTAQAKAPSGSASALSWDYSVYPPIPIWDFKPDVAKIQTIIAKHLEAGKEGLFSVTELEQTSDMKPDRESRLCKLYLIQATGTAKKEPTSMRESSGPEPPNEYILRVNLPIQPFFKTASEVATLKYLSKYLRSESSSSSPLAVSKIIAYDTSSENDLGFEWILLRKPPVVDGVFELTSTVWGSSKKEGGTQSNSDQTKTLRIEEKLHLANALAQFVQGFRENLRFAAIGSLYRKIDLRNPNPSRTAYKVVDTSDPEFVIGPLVSPYLYLWEGFWDSAIFKKEPETYYGPFDTETDYLKALCKALISMERNNQSLPDKVAGFEKTPANINAAEAFLYLLDKTHIFSSKQIESNRPRQLQSEPPFVLSHRGMTTGNILIKNLSQLPDGAAESQGHLMNPTMAGILFWESLDITPDWVYEVPWLLVDSESAASKTKFLYEAGKLSELETEDSRPLLVRQLGEVLLRCIDDVSEIRKSTEKFRKAVRLSRSYK